MNSSDHTLSALPEVPPLAAPRVKGAASALVALGFIALVALFIAGETNRAWHAWLIGMVIPLFLSVAGLAFLAVHRLCNAAWTAPLLRVAQGLTGGLPLTLVALIPFGLLGMPYVYEWAFLSGPDKVALLHSANKAAWLSADRVIITTGIFLLVWMFIRMRMVSLSLADGVVGDTRPRQVRWSVAFLLFTAYAFSLVAWDLILSLHVHSVSAMWGVYEFVGAVQAFLALLALCLVWLSRGPLKGIVREHTLKDLGTWLVGWSCVWAYITFAQYIIIAFANMDEETHWFLMRMQHGYQIPFVIECILRLPLPFFLLLSQHTRTKPGWLSVASVGILIGFVLQLCWQVIPALTPNHLPNFGCIPELMVAAGFLGGHLLLALHFWKRHGLVARGDRDLLPAVNAEHLS